MIPAAAEHGVGSASPVSRNPKHQITPSRLRRKTLRKDIEADVHTSCSTPNQGPPEMQNDYSPSDTFPYSQENCPEVVWDYTSPVLPKGAKKRELKITVDEFLKNLSQHQAPKCNTQNSHYIQLLEKWMTKQNTPVRVNKPQKNNIKKDSRLRSRQIYKDIQKLITSIQHGKVDRTLENDRNKNASEESMFKASSPKPVTSVINKRPFLESNNNDNDSMEELWGEADNSFIIKATQHLEVSSSKYVSPNKNSDIVSTIPETVSSASHEPKYCNIDSDQSSNKHSLNKAMLDSDYQAQILLTQIINCDWDSDSDNGDLENGFILGDEDLSLIPDELLCGVDTKNDLKENVNRNAIAGKSSDKEVYCNKKSTDGSNSEDKKPVLGKGSCELFGSSENDEVDLQVVDQSEIELFNNFEDESFGDESILCKPEVLSWIDEVESKLSQSQKCTPEEIEKKKDEAIQRRKKNQTRP